MKAAALDVGENSKIKINFTYFARGHLASVARVVERAPHDHEVPGSIRGKSFPSFFFCFRRPRALSASVQCFTCRQKPRQWRKVLRYLTGLTGFDPFLKFGTVPGQAVTPRVRASRPENSPQLPPRGTMRAPWHAWRNRCTGLCHLLCSRRRFPSF